MTVFHSSPINILKRTEKNILPYLRGEKVKVLYFKTDNEIQEDKEKNMPDDECSSSYNEPRAYEGFDGQELEGPNDYLGANDDWGWR